MKDDKFYINKAIELAKKGRGKVSPNPMVGCLVVKNDRVLSSGYHQYYGGPHAEVAALSKLKPDDCKGATLYVTLEPCSHQGKTPPCTELVCKYPFKRIVVGSCDPNPLVAGKGIKYLNDKGYEIVCGIEEKRLKKLNEAYIKYIVTAVPFVTLKAAISIDGKIATSSGDSKWITSDDSRKDAHRLRYFHDAVMVGIGTIIADDPQLDCRMYKKDKLPVRIVVDPSGRIPLTSKVVKTAKDIKTIVIVDKMISDKVKNVLKNHNLEVIELETQKGVFSLKILLKKLGEMSIGSVLIEGGGKTLGNALEQGIADKFYLYMAPIVIGENGKGVFNTNSINKISESFKLEIDDIKKIDSDVRLTAYLREKPAVKEKFAIKNQAFNTEPQILTRD